MSSAASANVLPISEFELLRRGRQIIDDEATALGRLAKTLDASFLAAVEQVRRCRGCVVVTGVGKAGLIGQKVSATFSSLGIRSHFLHPVEAVHGDLGRVGSDDVILAFSNSGETEELLKLLPLLENLDRPIVAVTADRESTLAKASAVTIAIGNLREAGPLGLAPTTTTAAMLAVGDALALVTAEANGFGPADFARFHPGGSLGRKLMHVRDVMRQGDQLRMAADCGTVRETLLAAHRRGRRTGAIMLVNAAGKLTGLFTDSDLSRLLEEPLENPLERPISDVMTHAPITAAPEGRVEDVISLLAERKLSELPVVDADGRPVGLIDITDVIALAPALAAAIDWC